MEFGQNCYNCNNFNYFFNYQKVAHHMRPSLCLSLSLSLRYQNVSILNYIGAKDEMEVVVTTGAIRCVKLQMQRYLSHQSGGGNCMAIKGVFCRRVSTASTDNEKEQERWISSHLTFSIQIITVHTASGKDRVPQLTVFYLAIAHFNQVFIQHLCSYNAHKHLHFSIEGLRERTEQLDIFCRVIGFTSDFLSFIDVELIWFFHGALQLSYYSSNAA